VLLDMEPFGPPVDVPEDPEKGVRWEHKVVVMLVESPQKEEDQLNLLGYEHWELVQVVLIPIRFANELWYYFKRKHEDVIKNPNISVVLTGKEETHGGDLI
jgi:hypothetical protein